MNKHDEKFLFLIKRVLEEGGTHSDRTGTGTRRIFGHTIEYDLKDQTFPLLTIKKMNLRLPLEEMVWMLSGSTNNEILQNKNVKIWNGNASKEECAKFGREENDLGPIYGHQWRNYGATKREKPLEKDYWSEKNLRWVNRAYNDDGFDQIKNICQLIESNPNSRRIILNAFEPVSAATELNPPPCHSLWQFQVDGDYVNVLLWMRSNDLFLGKNFNDSMASMFVHLLAKLFNKKPGKYIYQVGDAHIYNDHISQCKELLKRSPFAPPSIEISDRLSGKGFLGLLDFKAEDVVLKNYRSHGPLKGKMSV